MTDNAKKTRGGARHGAGRPTTIENKTSFTFFLSRSELDRLKTAAADRGISAGAMLRKFIQKST